MRKGTLINFWGNMPLLGKTLLIALAAPLLVINAWALFTIADYFHSLLVILIGAGLIAFLLNYPVMLMERQGTSRDRAAILVFLGALSVLLGLGITLVPIAIDQASQLVVRLPDWIDSGQQQLLILSDQLQGSNLPVNLDLLLEQVTDRLKGQLQSIASRVLSVAVFTVTSLLDFLLTLVLSFYLLQHGDELWSSIVDWLPIKVRDSLSQTLRLSFQNYFLGQFITATSMGVSLTLIFVWLAVPFGLLFGLTIGTMALVPFGGSVGIALVTVLVALRDIGLGLKVLAACVAVQQVLENFIAPKILGSMTGLNPVWIFLAVLTGARVGGLLGVVIAVPIAVVIKTALVALRSDEGPSGLILRASYLEEPHSEPDSGRSTTGEERSTTPDEITPAQVP
jgi:predicted PurR-regulated permease PerM